MMMFCSITKEQDLNNDIRIKNSFKDHIKIKRLRNLAGKHAPLHLIYLWQYASENHSDGVLVGLDPIDIEMAADWEGDSGLLFESLIKCRLLDDNDGEYSIHDWQNNQPYAAGAQERSDRSRFVNLARKEKDLYRYLHDKGVRSLSMDEYRRFSAEFAENARCMHDACTMQRPAPSPSPYPSPRPSPLPIPSPSPTPPPTPSPTQCMHDGDHDDLPF